MKRFFRGWMEKKQNGPPDDLLDRRDRPCLIPPRFDIPSAAGAFSAGSLVEVEEVPLHSHYRAQAPPRTLGLRAPWAPPTLRPNGAPKCHRQTRLSPSCESAGSAALGAVHSKLASVRCRMLISGSCRKRHTTLRVTRPHRCTRAKLRNVLC